MEDKEIVKALECCLSSDDLIACWKCPAVKLDICCDGSSKISNGITNKVIDLINRQKAEIEELRADYNYLFETMPHMKAETIKDFADKLKTSLQ